MVKNTGYVDVLVGTPLQDILADNVKGGCHVRILNGNPLIGTIATDETVLGAHTSEVTVIPEGDDVNELAGWIMPRFNDFSTSHSTSLGCRERKHTTSMHVSRVVNAT